MINKEERPAVTDIVRRPAARMEPRTAVLEVATERITAGYQQYWILIDAVNRMERRGEIRRVQRKPHWDDDAGQWGITVHRIKAAPPAWRKPLIIGLVLFAVVAGFLAAAWWALISMAASAGLLLLGLVLIAFVGFVAATGRTGGRRATQVSVNVVVK